MFQKVDENSSVKCVYCGADAQRLFSPVGIILKGSGFYTTDYKYGSKKSSSNVSVSTNKQKNNKKPETQSSDKKADGPVQNKKDKKS